LFISPDTICFAISSLLSDVDDESSIAITGVSLFNVCIYINRVSGIKAQGIYEEDKPFLSVNEIFQIHIKTIATTGSYSCIESS
jgi:hypothetical protein